MRLSFELASYPLKCDRAHFYISSHDYFNSTGSENSTHNVTRANKIRVLSNTVPLVGPVCHFFLLLTPL